MSSWTIAIRVDSSQHIGTGHVVRCLTMAEELKKRSVRVIFICRVLLGDWTLFLRERGFETISLSTEDELWDSDRDAVLTLEGLNNNQIFPDWLIIDHYQIGKDWERKIRSAVAKIMVIDDLADRSHDCDLLLDQNLYPGWQHRYNGLLPRNCRSLLGLQYLILREEFRQYKLNEPINSRPGHLKILLTFGGSDPSGLTEKVLLALDEICRKNQPTQDIMHVRVLVGQSYAEQSRLTDIIQSLSFEVDLFTSVTQVIKHFEWADCAISASGLTTYELAYVGLPSLIIAAIEGQVAFAKELARLQIHRYAGSYTLTKYKLVAQIQDFLLEFRTLQSKKIHLIDGSGLDRVLEYLLDPSESDRKAIEIQMKISKISIKSGHLS